MNQPNEDKAKQTTPSATGAPENPQPQKLETAEQAIERAKVVLGEQKAVRYEVTRLDEWMPTDPKGKDSPRAVWRVQLFDASNRYIEWVVLDETTGEPLQVGQTGNG